MRDYENEVYMAYMGQAPKHIPHWEPWSDPDAETYLTGINYFEHPRLCRLKMRELYPELRLDVPEKDDPIPVPKGDDVAGHTVRWGDGQTATFLHGEQFFKTEEDVFNFSPLEHADMRDWPHVVEHGDFRSVESCERYFGLKEGETWGEPVPVPLLPADFTTPPSCGRF